MILPAPDLARRLEALRADYARRLPERIRSVEEALAALMEAPADAGRAGEAYRRIHALAGSSGTYGFEEVFRAACTLKSLFRSFLDGAAPCDGLFCSRIATLLNLLRRAASGPASGGYRLDGGIKAE